ncbi:MAG: DNA translocase FtsK 4TM domain-containing protein [Sulfurimonas sp.]|uniref:FtsK/SpoIIIE family DNA translocase n=1 Tax=Sulfurimonas sp. TaxID=2022749 RepID=UPI002609E8B5|nr:DNA translocase FtsK 4TM domain-containing protein [Sulfurimonas sp.]MDD2653307.1 DNA translocase FtsK 4TM domain-containing protein [Sulfurimonas sp.]MDD3450716.1 DNA translocase FtsK 4TM domain-containing protein [Sulfurimonas sp.]
MKDALFILCFGLLIYLGFATILGDTALMGSFGAVFASYNHYYFGYISYVYIFASLLPLYIVYKQSPIAIKKVELSVASFLIFFSLLLAQALLVTDELRGAFGAGFVDFLSPNIGFFGLWIFWFIISLLSMVIIFEKSAHEMVDMLFANLKKVNIKTPNEDSLKKASLKKSKDVDVAALYAKAQKEKGVTVEAPKEQKQESTKQAIEKPIEPQEVKESAPLPTSTLPKIKEHNILELVNELKEQKGAIVVEELEENAKLLAAIEKGEVEKPKNFKLPSVEFLQKPNAKAHSVDESELDGKIKFLIEKLAHFKIEGDVVRTYAGPVVSTFEFKPAANVKVSRILNLQDDLAMALSAETIRIQAPIPGKDVVGIEIPNEKIDTIYLRELLDSKLFKESSSPLTIVLGKDIVGKPFVTDLKKLPHLLIAGTTGSGKSVGINAMILSLLYKNSPDQLRLLMIDPKMLEFSIYNDIPHLLTPVITKAKQAIVALNNMVYEMERRYALMSDNRTKNIESYNEKVKKEGGENLPYIVVIIDELADLMMTSGKDVEYSIARLAQMARASGIHLVVATQRPSVDVVTGLIKANLPSRISYRVGQKVDSKIILDQQGAESLLGKGDMLFTPPGATGLVRLHAPWSTEEEIEKIVDFIKSQRAPNYDKSFLVEDSEAASASMGESYEELDPMFEEAKNVVLADRKTSISYLQRKLQIGYNKSARLIEQLENEGILSAPNSKGIRDIL